MADIAQELIAERAAHEATKAQLAKALGTATRERGRAAVLMAAMSIVERHYEDIAQRMRQARIDMDRASRG